MIEWINNFYVGFICGCIFLTLYIKLIEKINRRWEETSPSLIKEKTVEVNKDE